MTTDQSFLDAFPPELTIAILQYLLFPNKGLEVICDIRSLALTSHAFHNFLSGWASYVERHTIATVEALKLAGTLPKLPFPRTSLRILSRRLGGLCMFCDLRPVHTEIFTNIQVCGACDIEYFPKLSHRRLLTFYSATGSQNDPWIKLDSRMVAGQGSSTGKDFGGKIRFHGPYYRWADIEQLVSKGEITLNLDPMVKFKGDLYIYDDEDGVFFPPSRGCDRVLFREFRSRFDSHWQPLQHEADELREYYRVCSSWYRDWHTRPWKMENFPSQPRLLTTNPYATKGQKLRVARELKEYRYTCRRFQTVMSAFPDILLHPFVWHVCMDNPTLPMEEVIQIDRRMHGIGISKEI